MIDEERLREVAARVADELDEYGYVNSEDDVADDLREALGRDPVYRPRTPEDGAGG